MADRVDVHGIPAAHAGDESLTKLALPPLIDLTSISFREQFPGPRKREIGHACVDASTAEPLAGFLQGRREGDGNTRVLGSARTKCCTRPDGSQVRYIGPAAPREFP